MVKVKELTALPKALEFQQARIDILQDMVAERENLLFDILNEVNSDYAHGGPSRLSEALIQRIEEIVLEK